LTIEFGREKSEEYENNFFFTSDIIFDIYVQASSKSISHERRVYAILDAFGDVGGFSEIILIIFGALIGSYSPNLFFRSVIRSVFRVDVTENEPSETERQARKAHLQQREG